MRQHHLNRSGADEEHGVSDIALAYDPLIWHREPRVQQSGDCLAMQRIEVRQEIKLLNQAVGVETNIEARPLFGRPRNFDLALQVVIDLARDQPFLIQGAITDQLLSHGRLADQQRFESGCIFGILPTQSVERTACSRPSLIDDLASDSADALAENRTDLLIIEADELLEHVCA